MKHMKGITIITLIMVSLFYINNVKAYSASSNTDGDSYQTEWADCDPENPVGCATWTDDFIVRVTLINEKKERVPGTKTIEFYPDNPDTNSKSHRISNPESEYEKYSPSEIGKIKLNNLYESTSDNYILIVGSNTAKNTDDMYEKYHVNMGIGPQGIEENFENYETIRKNFIDYATAPNEKKIRIWDDSEKKDKKITFVDFFLKVSGFTNTWEASTDIETRKKLGEENYYLLIEPVYAYGIYNKNGKLQTIRGTTKELAEVMYNNTAGMGSNPWFWVAFEPKIAYNHYCNFIEKGETGLFSEDYSSRCGDVSSFEFYAEEQKESYSQQSTGRGGLLGGIFDSLKIIQTFISFMTDKAQTIHKDMKNPNSNIGINVINLSETMKKIPNPKPTITNDCQLTISNCENNSYVFSSKLSSKDVDACVYPKYSNGNADQLKDSKIKDVVYNTGTGKTDLWCYDDVTYDFKELKQYLTNHKYAISTQLFQIPSGKVIVNRTCYSAEESNKINSVFKTDPAYDDNNYLKEIPFKIGGTTYNFKLQNKKYQIINGKRKESNFQTTTQKIKDNSAKTETEYYKYTQTFYYDYILDKGKIITKNYEYQKNYIKNYIGIEINDLSIGGGGQTTSIILDDVLNSSIIENPIKNGNTAIGTLTFNKENIGIGLSGKIKEKIKNNGSKYSTNKETYSLANLTNNYENKSTENPKSCEFMITTTDKNIVFRTIDLSNPFPGRDGTSRIPGEEWLSKRNNNVYEYIENNRGVKENEVYNKDPLYTITLTPSTMIELREYNKKYDYSYSSMTCELGTGRKCVSPLVHNKKYGITGGTCENIKSDDSFYTCADKTEKSGG